MLLQQVQGVLVSYKNNTVDKLAASANPTLKDIGTSSAEVNSTKEKPHATLNDVTELCHTLTRHLIMHNDRRRSQTPRRSPSQQQSVSRSRGMDNPVWCWYGNKHCKPP